METVNPGSARIFFDKWFAAINSENKLPRVHDKKLTIVALCALLELNEESIPASLKEGWPGIVAGIVQTFKELPKAIEGEYFDLWLALGGVVVDGFFFSFFAGVVARKALELALQEDIESDDDADDKFLNLEDTEGT